MGERRMRWPKGLTYSVIILMPLAVMPFALIARSRSIPSPKTRVQLFQDMGHQPKFKGQATSELFADHRAMRLPPQGTVARGELRADEHYEYGKALVDGQWQWAQTYPAQVRITEDFLRRGQERFDIYCAPCHGASGYGTGMAHQRAMALETVGWVPPASLHSEEIRARPLGNLYHVIREGVRTMPPYAAQIDVQDRWAIVAYVKALQLSQDARQEDVPEGVWSSLNR